MFLITFLLHLRELSSLPVCDSSVLLGKTQDYKIYCYNIYTLPPSPLQSNHISNSVLCPFILFKHISPHSEPIILCLSLFLVLLMLCCLTKLISKLKSVWTSCRGLHLKTGLLSDALCTEGSYLSQGKTANYTVDNTCPQFEGKNLRHESIHEGLPVVFPSLSLLNFVDLCSFLRMPLSLSSLALRIFVYPLGKIFSLLLGLELPEDPVAFPGLWWCRERDTQELQQDGEGQPLTLQALLSSLMRGQKASSSLP